jgi:hypothetical protein
VAEDVERDDDDENSLMRYEYDSTSAETVNVAAIYGRVEAYSGAVVSSDGVRLEEFDIHPDEIDRMEGLINGESEDETSINEPEEAQIPDDSEDESEALQRLMHRQRQELHFDNVPQLQSRNGGAFLRFNPTPRSSYEQQVRYLEVTNRRFQ